MTLRKLIFWPHLIAGSIAGAVVFIMAVTGVLLMYEKQLIAWADEHDYKVAASGAARLSVEALIASAQQSRGSLPISLTMRADPFSPAIFNFGRDGMLYLDPVSGAVLGAGSPQTRSFFRVVTEWHRYLGARDTVRPLGRAVTGASNLAFLFLILSGSYLWWPKRWTWQHVKPVLLFRNGLSGRARNFNWHNVFGLWCGAPLLLIVLGASIISYPWASNLAYRVAGSPPPKPQGSQAPSGAPALKPMLVNGLQASLENVQNRLPDWKTITLRLPTSESAPLSFTVDRGYGGQPQLRTTFTVNSFTGQIQTSESFEAWDAGRRFRTWLRFVHTGEYYGLPGQTVAGIASGSAAFLVWTGIALAITRFRSWRARRT